MNKPVIKLNQVAYVQVAQDILSELMPFGAAQGVEMVLIPASVLLESRCEVSVTDTSTIIFIDQVLKQVSNIDIIFHL